MSSVFSNQLACLLIFFYRRWLSPLKQGRCACGMVLGPGHSCSDVGLRAFRIFPFRTACTVLAAQLQLCRELRLSIIASGRSADVPEFVQPCCEILYDIGDMLASLARAVGVAYASWCVFKYAMGAAHLFGGMDIASQGVFSVAGASLFGAAATGYLVVFIVAIVVDVLLVGALLRGGNAIPFIAMQFALAFFVLHFEVYVSVADGNLLAVPYIFNDWWPSGGTSPRVRLPPSLAKAKALLGAALAFKVWLGMSIVLILASIIGSARR